MATFKKTLRQLKKVKVAACLSYMVGTLTLGYLLEQLGGLGKLWYVFSSIGIPIFVSVADQISKTKLIDTFKEEWGNAALSFHISVISTSLLIVCAVSNEIWKKEPSK